MSWRATQWRAIGLSSPVLHFALRTIQGRPGIAQLVFERLGAECVVSWVMEFYAESYF